MSNERQILFIRLRQDTLWLAIGRNGEATAPKLIERRRVNIPWGFQTRLFKVTIPSGIGNGAILRLRSMGRRMVDEQPGDLYLNVLIRDSG